MWGGHPCLPAGEPIGPWGGARLLAGRVGLRADVRPAVYGWSTPRQWSLARFNSTGFPFPAEIFMLRYDWHNTLDAASLCGIGQFQMMRDPQRSLAGGIRGWHRDRRRLLRAQSP